MKIQLLKNKLNPQSWDSLIALVAMEIKLAIDANKSEVLIELEYKE